MLSSAKSARASGLEAARTTYNQQIKIKTKNQRLKRVQTALD